jgi:predicted PurR-regulated permease PerM
MGGGISVDKRLMRQILAIVISSVVLFWALMHYTVVGAALKKALSVLSPLIVGAVIAFVLNVPVRALERRIFTKGKAGLRRFLSLVVTAFLVLLVLALLLLIVIPELIVAIEQLSAGLPSLIDSIRSYGENIGERFPDIGFWLEELNISWTNVKTDVIEFLKKWSSSLISSTVGVASRTISGIVNFILSLVFSVYMLSRKEQLSRQFRRLLHAYIREDRARQVLHVLHIIDDTFSRFVTGAVTEAGILGLMFLIAMLIFQFPYAVLVSALVAVLALIPIVGAFIAAGIGILLMLVNSPMQALWFLILFLVLQQIEGNLVYPRVVGDSIGLPALWVLAAVLVGGSLFGILGMLAGVPAAAVIYVLIREAIAHRLHKQSKETVS